MNINEFAVSIVELISLILFVQAFAFFLLTFVNGSLESKRILQGITIGITASASVTFVVGLAIAEHM